MNLWQITPRQTWDDRIEISSWAAYQYPREKPKPFIHPLVTPSGHVISGFEMSDHVWHRGLWFTIKYINGTNFWEEHAPFGVQVSERQPACEMVAPDTLRVMHRLHWTSQATGLVIREWRVLVFRGRDCIDWSTELHAAQDLLLDRTPYTTWGGYGGLTFRASRELHEGSFLLPGDENVTSLAGQRHDWIVMQAKVDGGYDQRVSIGLIDHPNNPRSPSPMYCRSIDGVSFMNAAFLFHEPLTLKAEQSLRFRYRVMYRDGSWSAAEFAALAERFRGGSEEA